MGIITEEFANAMERFKTHIAKVVHSDNKMLVLDWRKASGSNDYYVRYIVDIELGSLVIQGDLGDAIACWYNRVTPQQMYSYINSVDYFISKLRCTTNSYTYKYEDSISDLNRVREEFLKEHEGSDEADARDEINEDFDSLVELADSEELRFGPDGRFPEEAVDIFRKYVEDYYEYFGEMGRRVDPRIYLWITGYRMACEQLGMEFCNPSEKRVVTGKELTVNDIAIDPDIVISDNGKEIVAVVETWFDVDAKFNLNTKELDDTWLNMYAIFNPFEDTLHIKCELDTDGDVNNKYYQYGFDYTATENEANLIKRLIAEKIKEEYEQTPTEFCTTD